MAGAPGESCPSHLGATLSRSDSNVGDGDRVFCRICQSGYDSVVEQLISPCQCKGSVGLVHRTCVEMWLNQSNRTECEICKTPYDVVRKYRSFSEHLSYLRSTKAECSSIADFLCISYVFLFLILFFGLIGVVCFIDMVHSTGVGLAVKLFVFVFCISLDTFFVLCLISFYRDHWCRWRKWRATNFVVQLKGKYPGIYRSSPKEQVESRSASDDGGPSLPPQQSPKTQSSAVDPLQPVRPTRETRSFYLETPV